MHRQPCCVGLGGRHTRYTRLSRGRRRILALGRFDARRAHDSVALGRFDARRVHDSVALRPAHDGRRRPVRGAALGRERRAVRRGRPGPAPGGRPRAVDRRPP
ncbi:MAG: hypothetical protein AB1689_19765, partial [Thermodesulfobacteriota bacterium]